MSSGKKKGMIASVNGEGGLTGPARLPNPGGLICELESCSAPSAPPPFTPIVSSRGYPFCQSPPVLLAGHVVYAI